MKITNITQLGNSSANITVDIEDDIINNKYMEYPGMSYKYEYKVTVKPKSIVDPMLSTLITRTSCKSDIDEYLKKKY